MRHPFRRALTLILATSLAISGLTAIQLLSTAAEPASAVDAHDFDPAEIISDAVFYNTTTMTASGVQSFLNSKVRTCLDGYTCLKDYRQATRTIAADPMCKKYTGSSNESAAQIIYKVSQACGINPQVLIVLLQKEQGLVTDDWPVTRQYRSATGYGCPDTADCDSEYYGFFNQVYKGAWALKRYTMPPGTGPGTEWYSDYSTRYWPGETSQVLYNPDYSCGSSSVRVKNKATTSLYWYTPYQPNRAALDAGYGTGNGCSAYGNRNFFLYFSDWFGSVRYSISGAFALAYTAAGGASGRLGQPQSNQVNTSSGSWQQFEGGRLYQNSSGRVFPVVGAIGAYYEADGGVYSPIGAPVGTERMIRDGGYVQNFESGNIYWKSGLGAHLIQEPFQSAWQETGWENGRLGYPASDVIQTSGGAWQRFEGGALYRNSSGDVIPSKGGIFAYYDQMGGITSAIGAPISEERAIRDGGYVQNFESGNIYWMSGLGSHLIDDPIQPYWKETGWENGPLGYPASDPVSLKDNGGGLKQDFQGGSVYVSNSQVGSAVLKDAIGNVYTDQGGPGGNLGWPTATEKCTLRDSGCVQSFQGGYVYWTKALGAHTMPPSTYRVWRLRGYENGALGYPTSDPIPVAENGGGYRQNFERGTVYVPTGRTGYAVLNGPLGDGYAARRAASGTLGWPVSDEKCTLVDSGCVQSFDKGFLYWTADSGAHAVDPRIYPLWSRYGWEGGRFGYPLTDPASSGDGITQTFEGGSIRWTPTAGAEVVK